MVSSFVFKNLFGCRYHTSAVTQTSIQVSEMGVELTTFAKRSTPWQKIFFSGPKWQLTKINGRLPFGLRFLGTFEGNRISISMLIFEKKIISAKTCRSYVDWQYHPFNDEIFQGPFSSLILSWKRRCQYGGGGCYSLPVEPIDLRKMRLNLFISSSMNCSVIVPLWIWSNWEKVYVTRIHRSTIYRSANSYSALWTF